MDRQRRVLIVDDDPDIAHLVALHLRDCGCAVAIESSGVAGLARAQGGAFSLLILDLSLPDMGGLDVCRYLRREQNYVPILMLTARAAEHDRVVGLNVGADDYLTKPFSVVELVARAKAIFRRREVWAHSAAGEVIDLDGLHIDLTRREVAIAGRPVALTAKEFELLSVFAQNPGRVFSRTQLLDKIWGEAHDGYDHTVHSHINRLRTKIEANPAKPQHILTVRSVGYKFRDHAVRA